MFDPPQQRAKGLVLWSDENVRSMAVECFQYQCRTYLQMRCTGWRINEMLVPVSIWTTFNDLYHFTKNNPQMRSI
jgi:hypothetical protein